MRIRKISLLMGVILMLSMAKTGAAQDDKASVMLHIFSGLPDPVWTLTASETQAFRQMLDMLPAGEASSIPDDLGYRGFEVHLGEETAYVYEGFVQLTPDERWLTDPNHALEIWLLGTAGEALKPDLMAQLWAHFAQLPETNAGEGFAIYLVAGNMTPTEAAQADVSTLQRQPDPVIGMDDIIVYHAATYELELNNHGLTQLKALQVPVSGLPFVVCVDGEPIYAGAFWISYSSLSYYDSVVLDVYPAFTGLPVHLDLGYPVSSPELYRGQDLRSDSRILTAFQQAGKLD